MKEDILGTIDNIGRQLFSITQELEEVKQNLLTLKEQCVLLDNVTDSSSCVVLDDGVTGFTLDDLYNAFGKKKKSYAHRLRIALKNNNIKTLEDFLALTPGEFVRMKNIGYGTLTQTQKALEKIGFKW